MPQYTPPVRDTRFLLEHVVGLQNYSNLPGFDAAPPDVVEAVLEEGGRFVAEVLFPINQSGDQEGCTRHEDGSVTTPKGFKEAYKQFIDAGCHSFCLSGYLHEEEAARFGRLVRPLLDARND